MTTTTTGSTTREQVLTDLADWDKEDGPAELQLYACITDRVQTAVGSLAVGL
jgi:hypothetical protein